MRVTAKGEVAERFNKMQPELSQEFSYQSSPHLSMKFSNTHRRLAILLYICIFPLLRAVIPEHSRTQQGVSQDAT